MQLAARPTSEARRSLDDALAGIAAAAAQGAQLAVLPECTYPGYVLLRRTLPGGARRSEAALKRIARAARLAGLAVCVGIARHDASGSLRNEAVFLNRHGEEVARYAKMFLWNFDGRWFTPGDAIAAFDTEFGRLGMMVCADGRMPEIARTLCRRGAWLVLDPTAWVSFGATYDAMRNPQVDYVMSVRARENGVWIAAADKCGSELGSVHYVGRSMIVAPDGLVVASACAGLPALVVADAQRARPLPLVAALSPRERRALRALRPRVARRQAGRFRVGILQGPMRGGRTGALAALRAQGVDALVETAASARAIRAALTAVRGLRAAVIEGARMFAPEPARAAALAGADIIAWADPPRDPLVLAFARTRALENRVYVLVCGRSGADVAACVVDPNGAITSEALAGVSGGFVASIDARAARDKIVVPGSDVFAARNPRAFALFDGGAT